MEDNKQKTKKKKQKHHQPILQPPTKLEPKPPPPEALTSAHFKPSSDVKGLRFGGQFIVRSFTVRRAPTLELLRLIDQQPPSTTTGRNPKLPFPSTTVYLPTNFTILAHHAWHTLTLGLGTKKSKAIVFVFDSEATRSTVDGVWPNTIALGEVNRTLLRRMVGYEMARFKFRKGALTFYVYAVKRVGNGVGFSCADDLRFLLESMVKVKDFVDHTAMLALPTQRSIAFSPPVTVAH